MTINYQNTEWHNDRAPALNSQNLNNMEGGIKAACDLLDALGVETDADHGRIKIGDVLILWGTVGISMTGASGSGTFTAPYYKSAVVEFAEAFARPPRVLVSHQANWTGVNIATVGNIDEVECTVRCYASSATSTTRNILWVAIGKAFSE